MKNKTEQEWKDDFVKISTQLNLLDYLMKELARMSRKFNQDKQYVQAKINSFKYNAK